MKKLFLAILAVFLFSGVVSAAQVTLGWNPNSETDFAGYKVYYGSASGGYDNVVDVGNVTTYTVKGLSDGLYYYAVTAYDTSANESGYSNEVSHNPPIGNPTGLIIINANNVTVIINETGTD